MMINKIEQNYVVKWTGRSGVDHFSPFRFTKKKAEYLCASMNKLNGKYHSPTLLKSDELNKYFEWDRLNEKGNLKTWDIELIERKVGAKAVGLSNQ